MPLFRYEGFGQSGKAERGEVTAKDEAQAFGAAEALGITVVRLWADGDGNAEKPWYRRDLALRPKRLAFAEQAEIASQLAVLFRARLPTAEIVRIVAQSADRPDTRASLERLERLVADGLTLSDAFSQTGARASPLFLAVLRLADASPEPGEALDALSRFLRNQQTARRQIVGALIYPSILLFGALAVILLIALFLAPNLEPMFQSLDQPVPLPIIYFSWLGELISAYWPITSALILCLVLGAAVAWNSGEFSKLRHRIVTLLPVVGGVARLAELARLTRSVDMLISSGMPLPQAFREAANSFGGPAYGDLFRSAAEALEHGQPVGSVFAGHRSLPSLFVKFFQVGELSNRLHEVLPILAAYLDERVEKSVDRAMKLLTPIITLVVGGGIALLVYSVMSAILAVNDLAQ